MNNFWPIALTVLAVVVVIVLWRKGYLMRLGNYVRETREELKKCTWPTWKELKGSTVVVAISIAILGVFTMAVDYVLISVMHWITSTVS